jgi:predicted DCC family thiol-disulfide oxidoreductase YuxK
MAVEKAKAVDRIFYDGHCGLCHGFVRFVLAKDGPGLFRFAPLDSDTFRATVPEASRTNLGDSIVVLTADGSLLTRSAAVLHVLRRLGGLWRLLADLIRLIPVAARDRLYDQIARIRHRLFRRPLDSCPVVPAHLRDRFDL